MASSSTSLGFRLPEALECPVCYHPYSVENAPVSAGTAGCVHNVCKPCFDAMPTKKCPVGCESSWTAQPIVNCDLEKSLVINSELLKIILSMEAAMTDNGRGCIQESIQLQSFFVQQIEELNNQLKASQDRAKELETENQQLQSRYSELESRVSVFSSVTASQVTTASAASLALTQPQEPCCSTDIQERITQLREQPVVACSSTDQLPTTSRAITATPLSKAQVNALFCGGADCSMRMKGMDCGVVYATILAGNANGYFYLSLTDDLLRGLPLSQMAPKQISEIFPSDTNQYWINHHKRKMALVSPEEVRGAIIGSKFRSAHLYDYLSIEQIRQLPLQELSTLQINQVLRSGERDSSRNLSVFSSAQINALILAGKIQNPSILKGLTNDQLRQLPLSQMTPAQIGMMFPNTSDHNSIIYYKRKMALISLQELRAAFRLNKLNGYLGRYLPPNFSP